MASLLDVREALVVHELEGKSSRDTSHFTVVCSILSLHFQPQEGDDVRVMVRKRLHLLLAYDDPLSVILEATSCDLSLIDIETVDSSNWIKPQLHHFDVSLSQW